MHILPPEDYHLIQKELLKIPFNQYFARSVIERHLTGKVYVDDPADPKTSYIMHPYGLSLLFGEQYNEEFNAWLMDHMLNTEGKRTHHEWLQVHPHSWDPKIASLLRARLVDPRDPYDRTKVEKHTRVNFEFDLKSFARYRDNAKDLPDGYEIVKIDPDLFQRIEGLVVPKSFWDNATDFNEKGFGFCIMKGDEIVSWSYTVWIHGDKNEIGIETAYKYRGKGFSEIASKEFIKNCLKNHQTPVWSCRFENNYSYRLALKLGFRETKRVPFYRLCERGE